GRPGADRGRRLDHRRVGHQSGESGPGGRLRGGSRPRDRGSHGAGWTRERGEVGRDAREPTDPEGPAGGFEELMAYAVWQERPFALVHCLHRNWRPHRRSPITSDPPGVSTTRLRPMALPSLTIR